MWWWGIVNHHESRPLLNTWIRSRNLHGKLESNWLKKPSNSSFEWMFRRATRALVTSLTMSRVLPESYSTDKPVADGYGI